MPVKHMPLHARRHTTCSSVISPKFNQRAYSRKEEFMQRKKLISILILAGAFVATNPGLTLPQSVGDSKSERTGGGTPMPEGGFTGQETKGKKEAAKGQSKSNKDTSIGDSKSERTGGGTPMPEGGFTGQETKGKKGAAKGQSKSNKDTSVGGSQSERTGGGEQTPMPKK
jgi:hypothetical protein